MKKVEFKTISVKFDEKGTSHQLFIKQHKIREVSSDRPSELTLFVCNIPPYCTEECLKCLFSICGKIKSIRFVNIDSPSGQISNDGQPWASHSSELKGYREAYIVFNSVASLQTVLSLEDGKELSLPSNQSLLITGMKEWYMKYNRSFPDPVEMQKEIDSYMVTHDKEEERQKEAAKNATEADEDGWITVSKKSRNPGFARKQSVRDKVLREMNRKKKKKMLLNFYSFQIKESKMNHLVTMRKKFEEDKKKLETLKTQRKFKPF